MKGVARRLFTIPLAVHRVAARFDPSSRPSPRPSEGGAFSCSRGAMFSKTARLRPTWKRPRRMVPTRPPGGPRTGGYA